MWVVFINFLDSEPVVAPLDQFVDVNDNREVFLTELIWP